MEAAFFKKKFRKSEVSKNTKTSQNNSNLIQTVTRKNFEIYCEKSRNASIQNLPCTTCIFTLLNLFLLTIQNILNTFTLNKYGKVMEFHGKKHFLILNHSKRNGNWKIPNS